MCRRRCRVDSTANTAGEREISPLDVQLLQLHPGEIQHVIKQYHERTSSIFAEFQIFPLLGRRLSHQREFQRSDDSVHRRPKLVTHVGQELTLDAAGFAYVRVFGLDILSALRDDCGQLPLQLPAVDNSASENQSENEH